MPNNFFSAVGWVEAVAETQRIGAAYVGFRAALPNLPSPVEWANGFIVCPREI